jgi:putative integral membrane protein (TIGR02587 family)
MEVWWTGYTAGPLRLLLCMVVTFVLLLGYNRYAGMRPDSSGWEIAIDSIEELGLGLAVSAGFLFLLGRVSLASDFDTVVGKIVIEAMTVAIGISVGTAQLGVSGAEKENSKSEKSLQHDIQFGGQLVLATCGGTLFAANIAPTQEVVAIATDSSIAQLLIIMGVSLFLSALVLYYIAFSGSERFVRRNGFLSVIVGTLASYAVALVTAAVVLWFFGRFDEASFTTALAETIVLGLVTTLGASAGRLLLQ